MRAKQFLVVVNSAIVYQNIGEADWGSIALVTLTAAIGIVTLAAGFQGWLLRATNLVERVLLLVAGLLLVYPSSYTDFTGVVLIASACAMQAARKRSAPQRG